MNQTLEPVRPDLLETSRRLIGLGPRTLGQDLALARSPIWHLVSKTLTPDDLVNPSGPLVRVAGPSLTIGDQRLFAELFTSWARRGFPSDHRVSFVIADLAAALGLQHKGGKQYSLVRTSLRRLASAVFADVQQDGRYEIETGATLLAEYQARSRPGTACSARLNERTATTLLRQPMTYLDGPTWDAIMARDLLAARLWVWLEGERIRDEWRWSLFPSGREPVVFGLHPPARRTTPIAHLLTIDNWSRRRKIVERIRSASGVVASIDPRYELAVEPSVTDRGNYVLHCRRSGARTRSVPPDVDEEVGAAWRAASPRRRLSANQLRILRDLIAEWGASRVVDALAAAAHAHDPFARLLDLAANWREERDSAWARAKAAEQATATEMLQSMQQRRAMTATEAPADDRRTDGPTSLRHLLGDAQ